MDMCFIISAVSKLYVVALKLNKFKYKAALILTKSMLNRNKILSIIQVLYLLLKTYP